MSDKKVSKRGSINELLVKLYFKFWDEQTMLDRIASGRSALFGFLAGVAVLFWMEPLGRTSSVIFLGIGLSYVIYRIFKSLRKE